jgi:hypothetical protein
MFNIQVIKGIRLKHVKHLQYSIIFRHKQNFKLFHFINLIINKFS